MSTYRFISAEKARTPVSLCCRLLGVSRSGVYDWARRAPCQRELADAWLTEQTKTIHREHREVYGSPRIHAELRMAHGIRVGRKRVERLMRRADISGLIPKKRGKTTIRVPGARVADDLVERDFRPAAPNVLWVADITYLRQLGGLVYLVAIQDAHSRRIVGWSMAEHMRSELVVDALEMALARRRPKPGLIHHSDQGGQFASLGFGQKAREAGIALSMGSRGDAYDNAVAESFFATLKKELIHRQSWPTTRELIGEVFDYIETFYNPIRRHSTLGMLSPAAFELRVSSSDTETMTFTATTTHSTVSVKAGEVQTAKQLARAALKAPGQSAARPGRHEIRSTRRHGCASPGAYLDISDLTWLPTRIHLAASDVSWPEPAVRECNLRRSPM